MLKIIPGLRLAAVLSEAQLATPVAAPSCPVNLVLRPHPIELVDLAG